MGGPQRSGPPPATVTDMLGQPLEVGCLVVVTPERVSKMDRFTALITDIVPIVDPHSKAHMMKINLSVSFPWQAPRGGRAPELWRVKTQEQTGWMPDGMEKPKSELEL